MAIGTAALVVNTLIGGITGYLQSSAASKQAKSQAQQLLNNVKQLEDEIKRGELDMQQALVRIDTLISTSKGEIKDVMEKQVNLATQEIKQQYKKGLESAMTEIRSELGQRRLFGSEAGQETRAKTAMGLAEQAGSQTSKLREQALNDIAKQMAELNLKGGLMKEGKREAYQQFRLQGIGEIMQLQNMANTLQSSQASPFLGALAGAASGGFGDLIGQFFSPDEKLAETGTGKTGLPGEVK